MEYAYTFPTDQLAFLREDNEALKRQVEAFQNETDLIRQDNKNALSDKDNQMKMLQTVLQGMQQVNNGKSSSPLTMSACIPQFYVQSWFLFV